MKLKIVALIFVCLVIAESVEAEGVWFGPRIACPVPAGDVGDGQLGVDVGLTFDRMVNSHLGVGVDLAYQYWPTSTEYMAAYDRYLMSWFQTFDSATWGFSALQYSAHLKLIAPPIDRFAPWIQVGVGMYRVNRNLADPNWEGSPVIVLAGGPERIVVAPGWHGSVGVDFRVSSRVVLGLNATYQGVSETYERTVWGDSMWVPGFSAFTVGTHILFGM